MATAAPTSQFAGVDFLNLDNLLSEEERAVRDTVRTWVDENLDHRLLLNRRDPYVAWLHEQGEPLYLMDANPTAENIARLVFEEARRKNLPVVEVRLWETPSACATPDTS